MEKEFVPYELSVKLKALGFNEPCFNLYHKDTHQLMYKSIDGLVMIKIDNHNKTNHCSAPTFSQALRWFRENHRLSVLIHDCLDDYIGEIVEWAITENKIIHQVPNRIETYEQAELECLIKLIEIVESKKE
jgi:hypothetical protein